LFVKSPRMAEEDDPRGFWSSSNPSPAIHQYYSSEDLRLRAMAESFRPDHRSEVNIVLTPSSVRLPASTTTVESPSLVIPASLDIPASSTPTTNVMDASNYSVISSACPAGTDARGAPMPTPTTLGFPALSAHVDTVTYAGPRPAATHPGLGASVMRMPALSAYPGYSDPYSVHSSVGSYGFSSPPGGLGPNWDHLGQSAYSGASLAAHSASFGMPLSHGLGYQNSAPPAAWRFPAIPTTPSLVVSSVPSYLPSRWDSIYTGPDTAGTLYSPSGYGPQVSVPPLTQKRSAPPGFDSTAKRFYQAATAAAPPGLSGPMYGPPGHVPQDFAADLAVPLDLSTPVTTVEVTSAPSYAHSAMSQLPVPVRLPPGGPVAVAPGLAPAPPTHGFTPPMVPVVPTTLPHDPSNSQVNSQASSSSAYSGSRSIMRPQDSVSNMDHDSAEPEADPFKAYPGLEGSLSYGLRDVLPKVPVRLAPSPYMESLWFNMRGFNAQEESANRWPKATQIELAYSNPSAGVFLPPPLPRELPLDEGERKADKDMVLKQTGFGTVAHIISKYLDEVDSRATIPIKEALAVTSDPRAIQRLEQALDFTQQRSPKILAMALRHLGSSFNAWTDRRKAALLKGKAVSKELHRLLSDQKLGFRSFFEQEIAQLVSTAQTNTHMQLTNAALLELVKRSKPQSQGQRNPQQQARNSGNQNQHAKQKQGQQASGGQNNQQQNNKRRRGGKKNGGRGGSAGGQSGGKNTPAKNQSSNKE
jgi:hypothetical protein